MRLQHPSLGAGSAGSVWLGAASGSLVACPETAGVGVKNNINESTLLCQFLLRIFILYCQNQSLLKTTQLSPWKRSRLLRRGISGIPSFLPPPPPPKAPLHGKTSDHIRSNSSIVFFKTLVLKRILKKYRKFIDFEILNYFANLWWGKNEGIPLIPPRRRIEAPPRSTIFFENLKISSYQWLLDFFGWWPIQTIRTPF